MFLSSTLLLSPPSSSLLRRQIVNPHCGAAYGRALGPYFRGQIHHVWCGWCSHNSSLTGVMFSGIIQRSINTRAWRKYGAFIKTVNRKSFLQKPEKKKKKRITGFPEVYPRFVLLYCSCHLMMTKEMPTETTAGSKFIEIGQSIILFLCLIYLQSVFISNNNNGNFSELFLILLLWYKKITLWSIEQKEKNIILYCIVLLMEISFFPQLKT